MVPPHVAANALLGLWVAVDLNKGSVHARRSVDMSLLNQSHVQI